MPSRKLLPREVPVSVVRDMPYWQGVRLDKHGITYTFHAEHPTIVVDFSKSELSSDEVLGYFEAVLESETQDLSSSPRMRTFDGCDTGVLVVDVCGAGPYEVGRIARMVVENDISIHGREPSDE